MAEQKQVSRWANARDRIDELLPTREMSKDTHRYRWTRQVANYLATLLVDLYQEDTPESVLEMAISHIVEAVNLLTSNAGITNESHAPSLLQKDQRKTKPTAAASS